MSVINITIENMNQNIRKRDYVILGPIDNRAKQIEAELKNGVLRSFNEVIRTSIGDCHATGQKPITFVRQILASVMYPRLIQDSQFPNDVKQRALDILKMCSGSSVGAYSDLPGYTEIRKCIAKFIEKRDGGIPSDWNNIFLCSGASEGIRNILLLLNNNISERKTGVIIPIPIYPIYTAILVENGMEPIYYYLDESQNWSINIEDIKNCIEKAKKYCIPKAIVVINPGNPTGQLLDRKNMEDIIKIAYQEKLVILSDEVYQENVYDENFEFHSFKKVVSEMHLPYSKTGLVSFMSCSKGYMGECGIRGGSMEIFNFDPKIIDAFEILVCPVTSPNTIGQIVMYCVVEPPKEGEASYPLFIKEKLEIIETLKHKAKIVSEKLNSIEGFSCNSVQGALYAFPQIKLPPRAIAAAEKLGQNPDEFYAFQLLEKAGVCITPGSAFGQKEGTYHIRTTILPPLDTLNNMFARLEEFNRYFFEKYK